MLQLCIFSALPGYYGALHMKLIVFQIQMDHFFRGIIQICSSYHSPVVHIHPLPGYYGALHMKQNNGVSDPDPAGSFFEGYDPDPQL